MTTEPTARQRTRRTEALEAVGVRLEAVEVHLELEERQRKTQIRWTRVAVALLVLVMIGGFYGYRHRNQVDQRNKNDARISVCQDDNEQIDVDNQQNQSNIDTLVPIRDAPTASPQAKAYTQSRIDAYEQLMRPHRDCSPEGIADFYKSPQGPHAFESTITPPPATVGGH